MKNKLHPIAAKLGYKSNVDFYNDYPTEEDYQMAHGGQLSGALYNGQPTEKKFFERGWIPPGPVGFYQAGGAAKTIIRYENIIQNKNPYSVPVYSDGTKGIPIAVYNKKQYKERYDQKIGIDSNTIKFKEVPAPYSYTNLGIVNPHLQGEYQPFNTAMSDIQNATMRAFGGALPGGANEMPCFECGGSHAQEGGLVDNQQYMMSHGGDNKFLKKMIKTYAKKKFGGNAEDVEQDDFLAQYKNNFMNSVKNYGSEALAEQSMNNVEQMFSNNTPEAQYGISMEGTNFNPNMNKQNMYRDKFNSLNKSKDDAMVNMFTTLNNSNRYNTALKQYEDYMSNQPTTNQPTTNQPANNQPANNQPVDINVDTNPTAEEFIPQAEKGWQMGYAPPLQNGYGFSNYKPASPSLTPPPQVEPQRYNGIPVPTGMTNNNQGLILTPETKRALENERILREKGVTNTANKSSSQGSKTKPTKPTKAGTATTTHNSDSENKRWYDKIVEDKNMSNNPGSNNSQQSSNSDYESGKEAALKKYDDDYYGNTQQTPNNQQVEYRDNRTDLQGVPLAYNQYYKYGKLKGNVPAGFDPNKYNIGVEHTSKYGLGDRLAGVFRGRDDEGQKKHTFAAKKENYKYTFTRKQDPVTGEIKTVPTAVADTKPGSLKEHMDRLSSGRVEQNLPERNVRNNNTPLYIGNQNDVPYGVAPEFNPGDGSVESQMQMQQPYIPAQPQTIQQVQGIPYNTSGPREDEFSNNPNSIPELPATYNERMGQIYDQHRYGNKQMGGDFNNEPVELDEEQINYILANGGSIEYLD